MEQERPLPDADDLTTGTWIVVVPATPRSFIGRVMELDGARDFDDTQSFQWSRGRIMTASIVTLFPAFDFLVQQRSVPLLGEDRKPRVDPSTGLPELGIERQPYVNSLDFTIYPTPFDVRLSMAVGIYHFSQMHQADVAQYRAFLKTAIEHQKRYRQAASNIVAPTDKERAAIVRGR